MSKATVFAFLFALNSFAENTVHYQKELSNLKPEDRLKQLEKDLNPKNQIGLNQVNNWERSGQFQKCLQDEGQYLEIEQTLIKKWAKAWKEKSSYRFNRLIDSKNKFYFPSLSSLNLRKGYSGILIYELSDQIKTAKMENSFLSSYSKIHSVEITGIRYILDESFRSPKNLNYNRVHLDLRYDIRGLNKKGQRQNDRGIVNAKIKLSGKNWVLESGQFTEAERVVSTRKPALVKVSFLNSK